jgi:phosphohistidine phosphatase
MTANTSIRTLILMRHGKSGYPEGVGDHARPLADRGRREAALAGDWLRASQPSIDAVLCSTAARTRETLAAAGILAPTEYEGRVYEATPHTLIDLIRLTDDAIDTLLVVGHSPGMPWTAWELTSNRNSEQADRLSRKFPTSALAVLTFDRRWRDIDPGAGDLVAFHVPR